MSGFIGGARSQKRDEISIIYVTPGVHTISSDYLQRQFLHILGKFIYINGLKKVILLNTFKIEIKLNCNVGCLNQKHKFFKSVFFVILYQLDQYQLSKYK